MRFMKNIRGVIFDVDGVLLDSLEIWTDLGARYLVSIGRVPEEGLADTLFSMSMEQGAEYLKEHYDLTETAETIREGLQEMLRAFYCDEVRAKPDAEKLLRAISSGERWRETACSDTSNGSLPTRKSERASIFRTSTTPRRHIWARCRKRRWSLRIRFMRLRRLRLPATARRASLTARANPIRRGSRKRPTCISRSWVKRHYKTAL